MALPVTIASTAFSVDKRHVGGPFISSGGNVYVVLLDSADNSQIEIHKATDPTTSFAEQDAAHKPDLTNTVSSLAATQVSDVLHIAQYEISTRRVSYSTFNMATDLWAIVSETAKASAATPEGSGEGGIEIAVRSDGDVIILYQGATDTVTMTAWNRIKYARREAGVWTIDVQVDNGGASAWHLGAAVLGSSDRIHFGIHERAVADYQRCLRSDNSLQTFPAAFDSAVNGEKFAIGHGVSYVASGTTKIRIPYVDSTGQVSFAKCDSADTPTMSTDALISTTSVLRTGDAFQLCAVAKDTDLYALWSGSADSDLRRDKNANDAGFGTDTTEFTGTVVMFCANVFIRSGNYKLAYLVVDTATVKYNEFDLGSAGTVFTQTLTGAVTSSGAAVRQSQVKKTGTAASAGSLLKAATHPLAATLSLSGTLGRAFPRTFTGSLSSSGAVINSGLKTNAGSVGLAGIVVRSIAITRAGTIAPSGTMLKQAFKILAGALTLAGALSRSTLQAAAAALALAGSVTRSASQTLTGAASTAGALLRSITHPVSGTTAGAGNLSSVVSKLLAGDLTFSGALQNTKVALVLLVGDLTSSGRVVRQVSDSQSGSFTGAGDVHEQLERSLAGTVSSTGAMQKQISQGLSGGLSLAGTVDAIRAFFRTLTGTLSSAGTATQQAQVRRVGQVPSSGAIGQTTGSRRVGTLTPTGSLRRATSIVLRSAVAPLGSLTLAALIARTLSGVLSAAGSVRKLASLSRGGTTASAGTNSVAVSQVLRGSIAPSSTLQRTIAKALAGVLTLGGISLSFIGGLLLFPVRLVRAVLRTSTVSGAQLRKPAVSASRLSDDDVVNGRLTQ